MPSTQFLETTASNHSTELVELLSMFFTGPMLGVEIGVNIGATSACLLDHYKELFLHMVDSWQTYDDYKDDLVSGEMIDFERRQIIARKSVLSYRPRYKIHKAFSTDVKIGDLDWIFIDANHLYNYVLNDLKYWYSQVKDSGVIFGHDWGLESVMKAVLDFSDSVGIKTVYYCRHACWCFAKDGRSPGSVLHTSRYSLPVYDDNFFVPQKSATPRSRQQVDPKKRAVCIHVFSNVEYLKMAALCIQSFRYSGGKEPIYVMIDKKLAQNCICDKLVEYDVHKEIISNGTRQWCYNELFSRLPNIDFLINIDCDQYFNRYQIDFDSVIDPTKDLQLFKKVNWENEYAYEVYQTRQKMFYNSENDIEALFNISLDDYFDFLSAPQRWVWGNFVILNRNILSTPFWKHTLRMGFIYPCDEGAYMLAWFLDPDIEIGFLNDSIKQHIDSLNVIVHDPSPCLVHYPGPNYKEKGIELFRILYEKYVNKN